MVTLGRVGVSYEREPLAFQGYLEPLVFQGYLLRMYAGHSSTRYPSTASLGLNDNYPSGSRREELSSDEQGSGNTQNGSRFPHFV